MNPRIKNVQQIATAGSLFLTSLVVLSGTAGAAAPECEGQPATIIGTTGADVLSGTAADDVVWLGGVTAQNEKDVFVDTAGGNDLICQGGAGDANINAGTGDDEIHLWNERSEAFSQPVADGGEGNDTITGGAPATQYGGPGNDVLTGGPSSDDLYGGPGMDVLSGLGGDDDLYGGEDDDQVDAGAGADRMFGGPDSDAYEGGEGGGWDSLIYSLEDGATEMTDGVSMDLSTGTVTSDAGTNATSGIECFIGTPWADTIVGTPGDDCVHGGHGPGADTITGRGGNDQLSLLNGSVEGGDGKDSISTLYLDGGRPPAPDRAVKVRGGDGSDTISIQGPRVRAFGEGGSDTFLFEASLSFEDSLGALASGGAGYNTLRIGLSLPDGSHADIDVPDRTASLFLNYAQPTGDYTLRFKDIRNFRATDGHDVMRGSGADERLRGGELNDTIRGGGGDDRIEGGSGNDALTGGGGTDKVNGGRGRDRCDAERERRCERNV